MEIPSEALLIPGRDLTESSDDKTSNNEGKCFLALSGELPVGSDRVILGTAFMQSVYSILSVEMPERVTKIGFAHATDSLGIIAPLRCFEG